jgi:N-acetylated-alpha-linked acidic dipeptidase
MHPRAAALLSGCLVSLLHVVPSTGETTGEALYGFYPSAVAGQLSREAAFDAALDPREMRDWLERLSAEPNHVGSPHDEANARFILGLFQSWGWDAHIETFQVLYPTPREVSLELVSPGSYVARLHEPPVTGDRGSQDPEGAFPPYNAYGGDGDVTAGLVYVNYGLPDDYKELERRGIDVKGRIVIARYGGGWRGLKPKLAQEHGAVGCIIYSDPRNDGYGAGDVYPAGGMRPADGVQRGSVEDMILYPGDPLTPGVGATQDAKRLELAAAPTIMKIPVLPISYADATPLLQALAGPRAPASWRGGLPFTYHIGPGPAQVHLKVVSDWKLRPVNDVVARMDGSQHPDQWVIRGNHYDAWVYGAEDPLSGVVALLAEARAIGKLVKSGWRPRRTLVYATWDGEEPGLLGSTEWAEAHADELRRKAVLYVNSDSNSRGFLYAGGSHAFQHLVNQAAADVKDPQTGSSVLERTRALALVEAADKNASPDDRDFAGRVRAGEWPIAALGSGSDFSSFLQHLGVASINLGFGDDEPGGVYHSLYDSFDHYINIIDPGLDYGPALASTAGRLVLRVADADLLPLRFGDFAATVSRYTDELQKLADSMREQTDTVNELLDQHAFAVAASPVDPIGPPPRESAVPYLDFAPIQNAVVALRGSAEAFDKRYAQAMATGSVTARQAEAVNGVLQSAELSLTDSRGLPGRPWYRHMIYAPGAYTGYGVKTLPGIREAIEERRWNEANDYIAVTARALDAYRTTIDRAAAALD